MSYYCERCNMLSGEERCESCGKKELRSPKEGDYCFLSEMGSRFGEMFCGMLSENSIPYQSMPSGTGLRSRFALRLENVKIFVPYEFLDDSWQLLESITDDAMSFSLESLTANLDKLFISPRAEKKARKALKLSADEDLIAYLANKILSAHEIYDGGSITSCQKGGCYLFVKSEGELLTINSATYEIIDARKQPSAR